MIKMSVRVLTGLLFIVAAALKLMSIDGFELYIYSFNIFGFGLSAVLARLLICCEILLGLGLILKIRYKEVWRLSMLMLLCFTLFLFYVVIFRNDDNCHCFGDLISLNPLKSIVKNVITILLLLYVRTEKDQNYKPFIKKCIIVISVAVSIILPFFVVPTDAVYNKIISKDTVINSLELEKSLTDSLTVIRLNVFSENDSFTIHRDSLERFDIANDRYIINYISAGCKFCKMGANKLMMMLDNNNVDRAHIKFMVWGYDADILCFMDETNTFDCEYWFINPKKSIDITYGRFPTYVWIDKGKIIASGDIRDLSEDGIVDFLKTE